MEHATTLFFPSLLLLSCNCSQIWCQWAEGVPPPPLPPPPQLLLYPPTPHSSPPSLSGSLLLHPPTPTPHHTEVVIFSVGDAARSTHIRLRGEINGAGEKRDVEGSARAHSPHGRGRARQSGRLLTCESGRGGRWLTDEEGTERVVREQEGVGEVHLSFFFSFYPLSICLSSTALLFGLCAWVCVSLRFLEMEVESFPSPEANLPCQQPEFQQAGRAFHSEVDWEAAAGLLTVSHKCFSAEHSVMGGAQELECYF